MQGEVGVQDVRKSYEIQSSQQPGVRATQQVRSSHGLVVVVLLLGFPFLLVITRHVYVSVTNNYY